MPKTPVCYSTEKIEEAQTKQGLEKVLALLGVLNFDRCWSKERETKWPCVNRHLWRVQAMYFGGDCFLANFPGSFPHQRIWGLKGGQERSNVEKSIRRHKEKVCKSSVLS